MLKKVFLARFEPVLTEFSPFHHTYAPLCALRTYLRAVWWSHLELGEGCRLEDIYIYIYTYMYIYIYIYMYIYIYISCSIIGQMRCPCGPPSGLWGPFAPSFPSPSHSAPTSSAPSLRVILRGWTSIAEGIVSLVAMPTALSVVLPAPLRKQLDPLRLGGPSHPESLLRLQGHAPCGMLRVPSRKLIQ